MLHSSGKTCMSELHGIIILFFLNQIKNILLSGTEVVHEFA